MDSGDGRLVVKRNAEGVRWALKPYNSLYGAKDHYICDYGTDS